VNLWFDKIEFGVFLNLQMSNYTNLSSEQLLDLLTIRSIENDIKKEWLGVEGLTKVFIGRKNTDKDIKLIMGINQMIPPKGYVITEATYEGIWFERNFSSTEKLENLIKENIKNYPNNKIIILGKDFNNEQIELLKTGSVVIPENYSLNNSGIFWYLENKQITFLDEKVRNAIDNMDLLQNIEGKSEDVNKVIKKLGYEKYFMASQYFSDNCYLNIDLHWVCLMLSNYVGQNIFVEQNATPVKYKICQMALKFLKQKSNDFKNYTLVLKDDKISFALKE
jgi:hypothetical protein